MAGWLLENGIVTAVLAALVWALCRWGRIGPVWRHALWMVVLLKLLMPPVVSWPWAVREPLAATVAADGRGRGTMELLRSLLAGDEDGRASAGPRGAGVDSIAADPTPTGAGEKQDAAAAAAAPAGSAAVAPESATLPARAVWHWNAARVAGLLLAAWLAGSIGYAAVQIVRIVRMVRRVHGTAKPAGAALEREVGELAGRMKMRPIRACMIAGLESPYVWSLFWPVLLWPAAWPCESEAARGMIVHELAHVKRRDHWVGWMMLIAGCVWWWNPVYWLTCRGLRENAEFACDAWAVRTLPLMRRRYAEALLEIVEGGFEPRLPLAAGIRDGGAQILKARLVMIMQGDGALRLPRMGVAAILVLIAASLPAWAQEGGAAASRPKFTLSKETTVITSPLNSDGTPDYVGALNAKYSQGVTPENNGFVVWLETVGTREEDGHIADGAREQVLAMCGAKATPPDGEVWKDYNSYLSNVKKFSPEKSDSARIEMQHARLELWTLEQHPDFADYLTANNKWLDKMAEAAARPKWWSPAVTTGKKEHPKMVAVLLPSLGSLREAATELASRATCRAASGDFDGFLQDVIAAKRLSRDLTNSPSDIGYLVGVAINRIANDTIGTFAGSGKLTVDQCDALRRALAELPRQNDGADGFEGERWTTLDSLFWIAEGDGREKFPESVVAGDALSKLQAKLTTLQFEEADLDTMLKSVNQAFDASIAGARQPTLAQLRKSDEDFDAQIAKWEAEFKDSPDLRKTPDENREAYSQRVARALVTFIMPNLTGTDERYKVEEMRDQILDVLLVAAKVHAASGKWPEKLEALVPSQIKQVPVDFFSEDGKAVVKYQVVGDGVRIYSVGRNGVDDGGRVDSSKKWDDIVVGKQD